MFGGNTNKPAFGATTPNTSFGFGASTAATANPFGTSQLFGKPANTFGSPSTSAFGQPAGSSLFPSTPAQPTNLFHNTTPAFGTAGTTQSSGYGSTGLFGQQQQPASSSLFNTSSTFGQQNKPAGFGFGSQPTQPSLFGQQAPQQQTSNLFQPSTSNLFGSSTAFGAQTTGTGSVKFNPVTGTDTMMKNSVATSINTKHHSITCMKEYENKSFEELRYEDYLANRKGPQQTAFGATPFGGAASSAPSLFGQPDASKPAFTSFGQTTSAFGQGTSFGMANQQQPAGGLFGKPTTGFATTSSTPSLNFGFATNTQTNNPFGATQQPKSFGSATPIFGTNTTTTQQSTFGTGGGLFGQSNTQNAGGSIFGKPAQPALGGFGTNQTSNFSFSTTAPTQASNLFQPNKPLFGQTTATPNFGQTNTFGNSSFGSTLGKPAVPAFGTTATPAFGGTLGTGLQTQSSSLFGNTAVKPGGFFNNPTTGLNTFANNTFQTNTGFNMQPQQNQQSMFPTVEQHATTNLALLTADPFGDAPHLAGLEPKLKISSPSVSATNPKELKSLLDASNKVNNSSASKLKVVPIRSVKDSLFEGVSPTLNESPKDYVKTNCRRLVLKSRPSPNESASSPILMRMDILKHINSPSNDENVNPQSNKLENYQHEVKKSPLRLNFSQTINSDSSQSFLLDNSIKNNSQVLETTPKPNKITVDADVEPETADIRGSGDGPKHYPCNIICTRPEYYTLPPAEELFKYVDENGNCIVQGFTIGRKGYGNVYYPEEMDVTGLNIDELVHFRYREINVYPDDDKKPPIGQGLNRKAQVTLDNVYPRKPGTDILIKDIQELLQMNFAEKLRKITVNKGAKFVDYRPETGSWVFKIDHFSRYGFDESDEETVQVGGKEKDKLPTKSTAVTPTKPLEKKPAPKDTQLSKIGLNEGEEEDLIETSMYVDDISEEDYRVIPLHVPSDDPFTSTKNIQVMKSTLFADDDRSSDGSGSHISIIRQYLDIPDEIGSLPMVKEEEVAETVIQKKKIILRPKVDKVYNFKEKHADTDLLQMRTYQELGVFKGKSFKVGWSKGWNFYNLVSKTDGGTQLVLSQAKCGSSGHSEQINKLVCESLQIVLEESIYTLNKQIPTYKIAKNHTYLKRQSKLVADLMYTNDSKEIRYLNSCWTLADALWGPSENTTSNRRHLLSEWLKLNTDYSEEPTNDSAREIFNNLTVFKINEAANLAMQKRYPNLSLIISQLSLTNKTKIFLQEQIESWYKSMSSDHISNSMKNIYLLLSGTPARDDVNIFENIDWKRAFGMHMWYVSPLGAPIEMAIEMYKKAFEEYGYTERPDPPYKTQYEEDGAFDLLYHILLLYKSNVHRLSTVLNSATHTDDHLDYWLSWLLLQLFLSLDIGIMDDAEKTKLCTSFSNQLEALEKWEWAIFVLLYLEDNALKKYLVMNILDRNLSPDVDKNSLKSENDLVNKMQVPPEWIHLVKGEKTLLSKRYLEAFNHFAHAKDVCKANAILVEHLLPSLFINEQYDIIKTLISQIEEGAEYIENWSLEAGLFKDFMDLQEQPITFNDNAKLQMSLRSIGARIAAFVPKTNLQKLCIAEMSKRCATIYKAFCKKSRSIFFKNSYLEFMESLNMPPDFKQNEALYLINEIGANC